MRLNNKFILIILVLLVISLILFILSLIFSSEKSLSQEEFFVRMEVGTSAGFDLNTSALILGRLPPGTSSNRRIILSNDYDFPIVAEISVEGDIDSFLVFDPVIYLETGEKRNITISTINIPENTAYGNYTGTITIVFKEAD